MQPLSDFIQNDSDPNGHVLRLVSAQFLSTNTLSTILSINNIFMLEYRTVQPWHGMDTIQYVISDLQSPALLDTGYIFITVCPPIHAILDANNINARIDVYSLFGSVNKPGFMVPAGKGTSTIFQANLWMASKLNGIAYSSIRKYRMGNNPHNASNSGPISNNSGTPSQTHSKWEKVWKVYQHNIDFHLAHFSDPNYQVLENIKSWPAHGDTTIGEPFYLAPFFDSNADGIYQPLDGDYPKIKGDQAIFFIYNDEYSPLMLNTMKTETHVMAYAFQCQDSAVQNTVFVDLKTINRSNNNFQNTRLGLWADFDIGNSIDDYVQCDVSRNLFFGFNGDAFDDDNSGRPGFGYHPPSQGVLLLRGPKQDLDGQDNRIGVASNESVNGNGFGDGVIDNEFWGLNGFTYFNNDGSVTGSPVNDQDYLNYLSGYWKDGTHMVHGGAGHQNSTTATTIETTFMFPGQSDPLFFGSSGVATNTWTEFSAGNTPQDRRGLGATGPVTFAPNDTIELTYAFVFGRDYVNTGAQAGVDNMLERVDSIQSYYNQGILAPCGFPTTVNESTIQANSFLVYPNPTADVLNIKQKASTEVSLTIYDVTGKVLFQSQFNNPQIQISTKHLPKGMYFLKIANQNKQEIKPFIKE